MRFDEQYYLSKSKSETILEDVQETWLITDHKITEQGLVVTFDIAMNRTDNEEQIKKWGVPDDEYREQDKEQE